MPTTKAPQYIPSGSWDIIIAMVSINVDTDAYPIMQYMIITMKTSPTMTELICMTDMKNTITYMIAVPPGFQIQNSAAIADAMIAATGDKGPTCASRYVPAKAIIPAIILVIHGLYMASHLVLNCSIVNTLLHSPCFIVINLLYTTSLCKAKKPDRSDWDSKVSWGLKFSQSNFRGLKYFLYFTGSFRVWI